MYLHSFFNFKIYPHLIYVLKTVPPNRSYIDTAAKFLIDYHAYINVQYAMCIPFISFQFVTLVCNSTKPFWQHSHRENTVFCKWFFTYLTIHIHSQKDVPFGEMFLCI